MSRLPWKSLRLVFDLDRQIEQAFDELIHQPWRRSQNPPTWWPAVDVCEAEDAYYVVADLPGVAPAELQVAATADELTIRGRRGMHSEFRRGQTLRIEREHGEFHRQIRFAQPIDPGGIESRFEEGQLIVRLPKRGSTSSPGILR